MDINTLIELVKKREGIKLDRTVEICGNSMMPLIHSGDKVLLEKVNSYQIGDVLVFYYEPQKTFIAHRLLLKYNGNLYCKGDNSFALEKVNPINVAGRVLYALKDGGLIKLPAPSKDFISSSLKVNLEYCRLEYNKTKIKNSIVYQEYRKKYLDLE